MITPENIIVIVSEYFSTPIDRVLSTYRQRELVITRQVSMYFMRLYIKKHSLESIGRHFPGKVGYLDHATVLFGIKKVKGYIETDRSFKRNIDILNIKIVELFGLETKLKRTETETERFNRLWDERERILINENKYLKEENVSLKSEISKLRGQIFAMKLNKKKPVKKRTYQSTALIPDKNKVVKLPIFSDPYSKIQPSNGKAYSGFREHAL